MVRQNKKVYVVFRGKNPGIYTTWPACHAQVDGFSGNSYQSFRNIDDARIAWAEYISQTMGAQTEWEVEDHLQGSLIEGAAKDHTKFKVPHAAIVDGYDPGSDPPLPTEQDLLPKSPLLLWGTKLLRRSVNTAVIFLLTITLLVLYLAILNR